MSYDYSRPAATAVRMLKKYGRICQVISVSNGTYDPDNTAMTDSESSTDVLAADFDFSEKQNGQKFSGEVPVEVGDRYALVAPTIAEIKLKNFIVIDGVRWSIINIKKLAPAGVVVLWTLHIRK